MNKNGFTLLTTLIYAAIVMTVAVAIGTIILQSSKAVNAVGAKINQGLLAQAVEARLNDRVACQSVLLNKNFDFNSAKLPIAETDPPNSSNFLNGGALNQINLSLPGIGILNEDPAGANPDQKLVDNYSLKSMRLRFLNARLVGPNPSSPGNQIYYTEIWAQLQSTKTVTGSNLLKPVRIAAVTVSVPSGGVGPITACENLDDYPMAKCAASGGIYLNNGSPVVFHNVPSGANTGEDPMSPTSGCVPITGWKGQQGIQGPPGPGGGQPAPLVLPPVYIPVPGPPLPGPVPPPPPPPPPKTSDSRVKTSVSDFESTLSETTDREGEFRSQDDTSADKNENDL